MVSIHRLFSLIVKSSRRFVSSPSEYWLHNVSISVSLAAAAAKWTLRPGLIRRRSSTQHRGAAVALLAQKYVALWTISLVQTSQGGSDGRKEKCKTHFELDWLVVVTTSVDDNKQLKFTTQDGREWRCWAGQWRPGRALSG